MSQEIAKLLLEHEAVRVSFDPPFKWVSGILSPLYCDNRLMISFPEARKKIVETFVAKIKELDLEFEVIAGTASAAIPWAALVAYELNKPMIYIRKESKDYGAKKRIEGKMDGGEKVLILEDLISTGGSSVSAAQAVEEEGGRVTDVLAIVSWELKLGISRFEEAGLNLVTLTSYEDIIGSALEMNYINKNQHAKIIDFKEDPAGWAEKVGLVKGSTYKE